MDLYDFADARVHSERCAGSRRKLPGNYSDGERREQCTRLGDEYGDGLRGGETNLSNDAASDNTVINPAGGALMHVGGLRPTRS